MKKVKKIFLWIIILLVIFTICFIWSNSLPSKAVSGEISKSFYDKVKPIFDFVFGLNVITSSLFRKLAHWGEFCLLGLEFSLLFCFYQKKNLSRLFCNYSFGLWIAVIDESIQIFTGRGPMVSDILIDFFGYVSGFTVLSLIIISISLLKKVKKNK